MATYDDAKKALQLLKLKPEVEAQLLTLEYFMGKSKIIFNVYPLSLIKNTKVERLAFDNLKAPWYSSLTKEEATKEYLSMVKMQLAEYYGPIDSAHKILIDKSVSLFPKIKQID